MKLTSSFPLIAAAGVDNFGSAVRCLRSLGTAIAMKLSATAQCLEYVEQLYQLDLKQSGGGLVTLISSRHPLFSTINITCTNMPSASMSSQLDNTSAIVRALLFVYNNTDQSLARRIHAKRLDPNRPLLRHLFRHSPDARTPCSRPKGEPRPYPILRAVRWWSLQTPYFRARIWEYKYIQIYRCC